MTKEIAFKLGQEAFLSGKKKKNVKFSILTVGIEIALAYVAGYDDAKFSKTGKIA